MRTATIRRPMFASLTVGAVLTVSVGCGGSTAGDNPAPPPGQDSHSIAAAQQTREGIVPGYTITVPKLAVSSDLVGLGLNPDHTIQVPPLADPMQAGVYTKGPLPGERGPAVVLAHINAHGELGFGAGFHTLAVGDEIDVDTPAGRRVFRVTRVSTVPKGAFPTAAVYSDTAGPELRLITCGGELDRSAHNYLGQTIVYAVQA